MTYERERKPDNFAHTPVHERSRDEDVAPRSRAPQIDLAKIMASLEREDARESDRELDSILDPTVHAAPTRDPNATAVTALHPTLVLWTQRIERAAIEVDSARYMPGDGKAAMIDRIIENLENDEVAGFFLAAADHPHLKHLQPKAVDLPLEQLVAAYTKFEASVQAASAQLKRPFELKHVTMSIDRATRKFGHERSRVPPYLPPAGPQRDAPTWAANQLLASALADVRAMTAELGGRATVLDARQRLWTETLKALIEVLSSLGAPQRAKLRSDLKNLDSEGRALLDRAGSKAPDVPFEANKVQLDRLQGFTK